ncbi:MAG: adenosine deaminase [Candidatus Eremiobacteraeota bacterium]|nr:adenosine deaminase [Candidatus Eremiobacteraeota bacterium]
MTSGLLAPRIPKIHLHCHLEGCLRAATFVELAEKHGVPLRYRPASDSALHDIDRAEPYRFTGLQEFLYLFAAVSRSLQQPEDYARLAREFVEDALAQNVIYGELFVSPSVWTFFHPQLDVRETIEAIAVTLRAARPKASFKLLADLTRNFGAQSAMATARSMAEMTELDVIGIGLGGDECRFPAALFADAFDYARACGLHCVAHAGEAAGAQSVRDAVELLHAQRIGHGIHALDDPQCVELLAAREIALEICPTSNRLTGSELAAHPNAFLDFDLRGCVVTIDCDDPAIFRSSIQNEYALVERVAGATALERYVRNAIRASFASPQEKEAMEQRLTAAVAELPVAQRS